MHTYVHWFCHGSTHGTQVHCFRYVLFVCTEFDNTDLTQSVPCPLSQRPTLGKIGNSWEHVTTYAMVAVEMLICAHEAWSQSFGSVASY